ncbi:MAG: type II secretion system GspH family protein [Lentisphaeraceae bacterium]|nr:type II secretion system GspH family protein [Lentisphaeraceae bacterium]
MKCLRVTKNKKFTLIELLVVVALIGILSSFLLPAISTAREKTKNAVCKSNERQIGIASTLWSDENDSWVLAAYWYGNADDNPLIKSVLKPYTGTDNEITRETKSGIYHCPSLNMSDLAGTQAQNYDFTSYANNVYAAGYTGQETTPYWAEHGKYKLGQVVKADRKVNFMEHTYYMVANWVYDPNGAAQWNFPTRWHDRKKGLYGKSNILWFDGHVTTEPGDFNRGDWADYYFKPWTE